MLFRNQAASLLSFFSTFRIGYLIKKLNIPISIAPKTKLAQIFYNNKILQNRSNSDKPEYEYNSDLVYELFKILKIDNIKDMEGAPYLTFKNDSMKQRREIFIEKYNLNPEKKIIFIHPGTGGSSKSLNIESFAGICKGLRIFDDYNFIVHYSPEDEQYARNLKLISGDDLTMRLIEAKIDISHMLNNISICDIFMAGSTGPLHVAGALNKKTVGFYPSKKSSTSLRWDTINNQKNKLFFEDTDIYSQDIQVDIQNVAAEIYTKLLK